VSPEKYARSSGGIVGEIFPIVAIRETQPRLLPFAGFAESHSLVVRNHLATIESSSSDGCWQSTCSFPFAAEGTFS